jgi:hypothetical protein
MNLVLEIRPDLPISGFLRVYRTRLSDRDSFDHPQDMTVVARASADRSTYDAMNLN